MRLLRRHAREIATLVAGTALFCVGVALAASTATVSMTATGPEPATVTVGWGGTVAFVNSDSSPHSIASADTEIGTMTVAPGQTVPLTFTGKTGTKRYVMSGKPKAFFYPAILVTLDATLTLNSAKGSVAFGQAAQLLGKLSLAPGSAVTIQSRPLNKFLNGAGDWRDASRALTTGGSGEFSYRTTPTAGAEYQAVAAAGQLVSKPVKIAVAPVITVKAPIRAKVGQPVTVRVKVRPGDAASSVDLEQYVPRLKRWHAIAHLRLSHGVAVTKLSVQSGRSLLRVSVTSRGLSAPGFSASSSSAFTIVGS